MKQLLTLLLLLTIILCCVADEPPSWSPYKIISKNNNFFCLIDYADRDTLKFPWERKWKLKVFKKDSTLAWQKDFQPSGYDDGILSNDGNSLVIIYHWYAEKGRVVEIHNRNLNDYFIKGEEFKISPTFLKTTASRKLWIDNYQYKGNKILIETNDHNIWEIDLVNSKLKLRHHQIIYYYVGIITTIIIVLFVIIYRRRIKPRL